MTMRRLNVSSLGTDMAAISEGVWEETRVGGVALRVEGACSEVKVIRGAPKTVTRDCLEASARMTQARKERKDW